MPELPEVETIVNDLRPRLVGRRIVGVQSDCPKYFGASSLRRFKRCVLGRTIVAVERRAKRIVIDLDNDWLLVIHQKISGRLLVGRWRRRRPRPRAASSSPWEPRSPSGGRFVHLLFDLDDGRQLGLSDLRKFATILCGPRGSVMSLPEMSSIGPEPLDPAFTYEAFHARCRGRHGAIKPTLMNPAFIAGIGNIYSDEILYAAGIHPLSAIDRLRKRQLEALFHAIKAVLTRAVRLRGTGVDAPPLPERHARGYDRVRLVYHRIVCPRGHRLRRIKIGGRSAHFCPVEQHRS